MGNQTGYTLGQMLFQNDSIPLTVTSLLEDCAANEAIWNVMYLENLVPLDMVTNYKSVSYI